MKPILLREYIEFEVLIREYTVDGESVSHRVESPIESETANDVFELPPNPLLQLQRDNELLKERLEATESALIQLMMEE